MFAAAASGRTCNDNYRCKGRKREGEKEREREMAISSSCTVTRKKYFLWFASLVVSLLFPIGGTQGTGTAQKVIIFKYKNNSMSNIQYPLSATN